MEKEWDDSWDDLVVQMEILAFNIVQEHPDASPSELLLYIEETVPDVKKNNAFRLCFMTVCGLMKCKMLKQNENNKTLL